MIDPLLRSMVYPVPPVTVPSPPPVPLEEVTLQLAGGGRAVGWFLEPSDAVGPLVLFFHGNGENLETMRSAGTFEAFQALGAAVLAVDYPGYGNSPGTPSEPGLHATADAALAWASERFPQRPIVAVGWSLGAAVAVALAARAQERLAGLVAFSAWTSLPEVASRHFPAPLVRMALSERYDSLAKAAEIRLLALVAHGRFDNIIPAEQGQRLAEALAGPTTWLPVDGAGHNDLLARREVWEALEGFLRRATGSRGAARR